MTTAGDAGTTPDSPPVATRDSSAATEGTADPRPGSTRLVDEDDSTPPSPRAPRPAEGERQGVLGTSHGALAFGFLAATGALLAWFLSGLLLSVGSILLLIVVALFLAAGLDPSVEFFCRRGLKRPWAVLIVISCVLAALALFLVALVPVITAQVNAIVDQAPDWLQQLGDLRAVQELDARFDIIHRVEAFVTDGQFAAAVFGGVVGFGLAVLSALASAFVVVVLTLYFLSSLASIKAALWTLAPASRRDRVTSLGERIFASVGNYVAGAFVVALISGASSLVFLLVVGLSEYAVALAAVVALLGVIPMIGATIGAVIVSAIGFATDLRIGIACVVFYVIYQQVENYLIYPRVMQRSFDLHGAVIVIAALIGATLLGVVGALLAIPTAAALSLILKEVWLPRQQAR